jgi:hypothetical protein
MKKEILSLMVVAGLVLSACGNDNKNGTSTSDTDNATKSGTTAGASTETTTQSSSNDYAAMADEFERNSTANKYYDPRTGKNVRISVDRTTGKRMNTETRQPITRYIYNDNNDWWVYDAEGTRLGRARMNNNRFQFQDDSNNWVDYDARWKHDDDESKLKTDDMKVKIEKDGDMKIKTKDKKIKVEDGVVKEKDN